MKNPAKMTLIIYDHFRKRECRRGCVARCVDEEESVFIDFCNAIKTTLSIIYPVLPESNIKKQKKTF